MKKKTNAVQTSVVVPVLPDPGVDVFIKRKDYDGLQVARLSTHGVFYTASFGAGERGQRVSVADVERWDFAIPAGDLLC